MRQIRRFVTRSIAVGLAGLTVGATSLRADELRTQAGVDGSWFPPSGTAPINGGAVSDYWHNGVTAAAAGASRGPASAAAAVNLTAGPLDPAPGFRFSVTATSDAGTFFDGHSEIAAKAQWFDVIRVSGNPNPGSKIQVHVAVSANVNLSVPSNFIQSATARFGVSSNGEYGITANNPSSPMTNPGYHQSMVEIVVQYPNDPANPPYYPNRFTSSNTQNLTAAAIDPSASSYAGSVSWDAVFDHTYQSQYWGYVMNLSAGDYGNGYKGGDVEISLATVSVTGLTATDGGLLAGSYMFDSGYSLTPTPEPGTALGLAAAGLAAAGWVRRRRTAVTPSAAGRPTTGP